MFFICFPLSTINWVSISLDQGEQLESYHQRVRKSTIRNRMLARTQVCGFLYKEIH